MKYIDRIKALKTRHTMTVYKHPQQRGDIDWLILLAEDAVNRLRAITDQCNDYETSGPRRVAREFLKKFDIDEKPKLDIPFNISNTDLKEAPTSGREAECPRCKKNHGVVFAEKLLDDGRKIKDTTFGFVNCGKNSYMVSLMGKQIPSK